MQAEKNNLRIGVLLGGLSPEREISIKSGKAVAKALRDRGWRVTEIDVDERLPIQLLEHDIDIAWIALHGIYGEDGCVQGLLEVMGIPYTGSSVQACAISMDKEASKNMLRGQGVNLIPDQVVAHGEEIDDDFFPCVFKDPLGGSSIGIWMCHSKDDVEQVYRESDITHFLVERFIEGEEITVAVHNDHAFPVISIRPKEKFFDLEAKYTKGKTDYLVPSPLPDNICLDAQKQAVSAYKGIGERCDKNVRHQHHHRGEVYYLVKIAGLLHLGHELNVEYLSHEAKHEDAHSANLLHKWTMADVFCGVQAIRHLLRRARAAALPSLANTG